ncbi:MAG: beta-galactosidase [Candidatus Hydrogenedentes bacterium]|nr:beta-galactosidase [Candidatus Hydrogenedentota bacterium]
MVLRLLMPIAISAAAVIAQERPIETFDGPELPTAITQNHVEASIARHEGERVLEVHFSVVDWPNVTFTHHGDPWDWSESKGLAVDVYNPEAASVEVSLRVDNADADTGGFVTVDGVAPPEEWTTLRAMFRPTDAGPFWGMRGIPVVGPLGNGKNIDASKIVAYQVFLPQPKTEHTLLIDNVRLYGESLLKASAIPFPFVDRFGQYRHGDWPGKAGDVRELETNAERESNKRNRQPAIKRRDRFGGWAGGPQRRATGWFRTDYLDGKWWLITPEGHLFFSAGMDCVIAGEQTFVDRRPNWFEWLPAEDDPLYGVCYERVEGAHSMADTVGGKGLTFNFYRANLIRKYDEDWRLKWREAAYARLKDWGFNTIGNWSQSDVLENSPMPFTVSVSVHGGLQRIEGGGGYWSKVVDAYAPSFAETVESSIGPAVQKWAANPLCIGYFVDNEISWDNVVTGTLASPPDQPCRVAQIELLKQRYGDIASLNKAWETTAADWDSLRVPANRTYACKADLDAYLYAFAHRYFEIVNTALKKVAPNQLYLGCRFCVMPDPAVRACADVADVVSFDLYYRELPPDAYTYLGKPLMIGEFHFGALDRGMFHTGLVDTVNQGERAASFERYVNSVLENPSFVGCHWFQYLDDPVTGRWYDGENYNIGFVTVADEPYPEMASSARNVFNGMYERRFELEKYASRRRWTVNWDMIGGFLAGVAVSVVVAAVLGILEKRAKAKAASPGSRQGSPE